MLAWHCAIHRSHRHPLPPWATATLAAARHSAASCHLHTERQVVHESFLPRNIVPQTQELSTAPEDSRDDSCLSCAREALNLCYACSPAMGRSKQERAASRDGASGGGGSGDAAGAAAATPSHMLVYARTDCGLCKQAIDTEGEEHIAGEGCGGGGRGSANNPALWLVPWRAVREPLPTGSPLLQASALCATRFQSTYIVRRM